MKTVLNSVMLKNYFKPILASCNLWKNENLHVCIIANPASGGFTQKKNALKNKAILDKESKIAEKLTPVVKSIRFDVFRTEYAGEGEEFVKKILEERKDFNKEKVLIMTVGGDGNCLEVQTALTLAMKASKSVYDDVIENFTLLRLPFGTGNDGSDGRSLDETLLRLTKPSHIEYQKGLEVACVGKVEGVNEENPVFYAFNIASIGIDAFITHMTNKVKKFFPGDFYKIWVDLACLFYSSIYKKGEGNIEIYKNDELVDNFNEAFEFCLLGVSGHRTYGSNHKILPHEETCCIYNSLNLWEKLKNKKCIKDGGHYGRYFSHHYFADKLKINYKENILVQLDGETHLLREENFPIEIRQTRPFIPVIVLDDDKINKGTSRKCDL